MGIIEGSLTRVYRTSGAPTGSTLAGVAGKGALLVDETNAKLYINTGTQTAPTWTVAGTQT